MEASGVNHTVEPEEEQIINCIAMTKGKAERTFARKTNFVAKSIRVRSVSSN